MRRHLAVVKIGGSLARSPELPVWLDQLAEADGRAVVVPGGGPFADQVRDLQGHWRFDDRAAHHMAVLAMDQFGRMLAAMNRRCVAAASRRAIREAGRKGGLPVWLPTRMTLGRPDIDESWDVTADSLAAWLAAELGADMLYLVKSAALPDSSADLGDLVRRKVVDPAFPAMLSRGGASVACAAPAEHENVARAIRAGGVAGTAVRFNRSGSTARRRPDVAGPAPRLRPIG